MNPPVRRVFKQRQRALFAGHCPEVIESIAWSSSYGMIAVWQQDRVAVSHLMRDGFAVVCINCLISESLRRIDPIVIDLFQFRLAVAAVVLVRWEAAPVARRVEGFTHHQS